MVVVKNVVMIVNHVLLQIIVHNVMINFMLKKEVYINILNIYIVCKDCTYGCKSCSILEDET